VGIIRTITAAAIALWTLCGAVQAQTNPNLTYGQVLTPAQWNNLFASKQDYLGAPPLLTSGGTMTGKLVTATPNTSVAGLTLPHGTAPTVPINGDMWTTTAGLFVRINGTTIGPLIGSTGAPVTSVSNSDSTLTISPTTGNVVASLNLTHANTWTGLQTFSSGATVGTGLTVTGFFTATGLVTNADLANASVTVNGTTCTLGSSCTPSATAASVTIGTTTIASGTTTRILYDNAGVLGEYTITGTGTVVAMATSASLTSPSLTTPSLTSPTISGGTIDSTIIGNTIRNSANFTSVDTNNGITTTLITITSTSASALAVGRQGATNPVLQVDASTATVATGLKVKGAAAGGGLALSVITSGTNENVTFDAAGSGTITIAGTSTGAITLTRATTLSAALTYGGVTLSNSVTGTGSMVLSTGASLVTPAIGVATGTSLALNGCTLSANAFCATGTAAISSTLTSAAHTVTSASANALAVGLNGSTNPALQVDASTASSATGLKIKSAAAAGGLALSVITSGTNDNLTLDAAGSGTITVGGTSTGAITLTRATTLSAALTYGGVTLSNSVTGTGSMVLSNSPSLTTPTLGAALFTSLAGPIIGPQSNSTTAVKITKADLSTSVMTFDTTNARVGINKTPGAFDLDVNGAVNVGGAFTAASITGPLATSGAFGVVKVDGTTITATGGVITAVGAAATSISVGTTTISSGTTNRILYDNAGVLGELIIGNGLENSSGTLGISAARRTNPTIQRFTSGSGTYTAPANVTWIRIKMWGSGGGGSNQTNAGTNGGNTCWNTSGAACTSPVYQAGGGGGSGINPGDAGAGGTVSGSGSCNVLSVSGGRGSNLGTNVTGRVPAGMGGGSYGFPPSTFSSPDSTTVASQFTANGGGGGTYVGGGTGSPGGGGGGGAYCETIIGSPAATYTYAINSPGTGGATSGGSAPGADGIIGLIVVEEYYNN
jgi:hypothetical protein